MSNTGITMQARLKELFNKFSETTVGWNNQETGNTRYYCTNKVPLDWRHPFFGQVSLMTQYEIDHKKTKFDSKEHILSAELQSETPWSLRLEQAKRANYFGLASSRKFLETEV